MKCLDAQKAGKIRFIGFTGHRSPVHSELVNAMKPMGDHIILAINSRNFFRSRTAMAPGPSADGRGSQGNLGGLS
jgi:hypothetical protein